MPGERFFADAQNDKRKCAQNDKRKGARNDRLRNMDTELLNKTLADTGITTTTDQVKQLVRYYDLLMEKNKVMNLTAIKDPKEAAVKHFADSLILTKYYEFRDGDRVLDLGTGGGFPGMPLKILYPDVFFLLMDSVNKKLNFIREAVEDLGLRNIEVLHGRAEDIAHSPEHRGKYDVVVSRAVAALPVLIELSLGFVKPGGYFISYKGVSAGEEISASENALKVMGGIVERVEEYSLPDTEERRNLIFIRKTPTPSGNRYPRKPGLPGKTPL